MKKFLRVGKIPIDEKSKIFYNGEYIVGEEAGVSCYELIDYHGTLRLILPAKFTSFLVTDLQWSFTSGEDIWYIITGDEVGYGSDGEPLLRNIKILEEISINYFLRNKVLSDIYSDDNLEGVGYPDTYYVKLYDLKWTMSSKKFFDRFTGKKIYLKDQYKSEEVEEFWRLENNEEVCSSQR